MSFYKVLIKNKIIFSCEARTPDQAKLKAKVWFHKHYPLLEGEVKTEILQEIEQVKML